MSRAALVVMLLHCLGCDGKGHLEARLRVAAGTHPLAGADTVSLLVAGPDGAPLGASRVAASSDGISVSSPVISGPLTLTVEASRGADVLARGQSCASPAPAVGARLTVDVPLQLVGSFAPAAESPAAADGAALLALSEQLFLVGGTFATGAVSAQSQSYAPGAGRFTNGPSLGHPTTHALVMPLSDGTALVLGGGSARSLGVARYAQGELIDAAAAFPGDWQDGAAVMLNGQVLCAGGRVATGLSDGVWLLLGDGSAADAQAPLPSARAGLTLTAVGLDGALAAGGLDSGGARTDLYLFESKAFVPFGAALSTPRHHHTATLLTDGTVLVAGGFDGAGVPLASVERVDPVRRVVVAGGPLSTARGGHAAMLLADGRVLLVGGVGAGGEPLAEAELWDPSFGGEGGGLPTGSMTSARATPSLARLCDGTILVAGGAPTVEAYRR